DRAPRRQRPVAGGWLQLQGRARRCTALAAAVRRSLCTDRRRPARPRGHRLWRLWCAGEFPGRCRRRHPLQARRAADLGCAGTGNPAAGGDHTLMRTFLATILVLLASTAWAIEPLPFRDAAEEERFRALAAELRCVMCQNQSLADS